LPLVIERAAGEDFYVGQERFVVASIESPTAFTLRRDVDGKMFHVVDGTPREIAASIRISVGSRGQNALARISIEAPRTIRVLRGELYRSQNPGST
jgi:hypothetical protein